MPITNESALDIVKNEILRANFSVDQRNSIVSKLVGISARGMELLSWNVDMSGRFFEAIFESDGNKLTLRYGIDRGTSISTEEATNGFFDWMVNF